MSWTKRMVNGTRREYCCYKTHPPEMTNVLSFGIIRNTRCKERGYWVRIQLVQRFVSERMQQIPCSSRKTTGNLLQKSRSHVWMYPSLICSPLPLLSSMVPCLSSTGISALLKSRLIHIYEPKTYFLPPSVSWFSVHTKAHCSRSRRE